MFKNLKLKTKLLITIVASIILICISFVIFGVVTIGDFFKRDIAITNRVAKADFSNLFQSDANMLEAAANVFASNEEIQNIYLSRDRDALYKKVLPLFNEIKAKNGITHMYFIDTDGKVFLREHEKNLYGDKITRQSFMEAQKTKLPKSSIELGKITYALRMVVPYYHDGKLLGYIEMAEEIDKFKEMMKEDGDIVFVAEKNMLNKTDYDSVIGDGKYGWDYFQNYAILSKIDDQIPWKECLTEKNINEANTGFDNSKIISKDGKIYACGGFPIVNGGIHSGFVFSMKDMTERANIANGIITALAIMALIVTIISIIIIYGIFSRNFKRYQDVLGALSEIKNGNYNINLPVIYHDEIGELSEHINSMTKEIRFNRKKLEDFNQKLIFDDKIKTEFISIASHELLTPTSIIEGYSSMILDDKLVKVSGRAANYLSKIHLSSQRLAELVKEILDVSRIDQKGIIVNNFAFDIVGEADRIMCALMPKLKAKKLKFKSLGGNKKMFVFADSSKTEQILYNLITNAIKYSDKGTIDLSFKRVAKNGKKMVEFSIKDTGIGIDKDEKKNIFKKFFRTSNGSENCDGGTGLGLYISQNYAHLMGGEITFTSELGKGSEFKLMLNQATEIQIKNQNKKPVTPNYILVEKK